ncbi:MAG: 4-hydroxybutyrate dehydrogenase [Prevotellaceae bacterium]|jgi:4-hydroxybutyrate dehydrogenase|nr:4-hydroxybutyrate dehydrogenase [Prevotellaceae bacterium]
MQLFKLKTKINNFDSFADFASEFNLSAKDLIITHEFLYEPFMKALQLPCHFVMQEKYGNGEPSDEMMNKILADVRKVDYDRVIAIGGGTVIDIAKLFVLKGVENVTDAFERKISIEKEKALVILPTTCGTGSEVTNISIAEIKSKHTKMGLADEALLADDAVMIPELLKGLPYKFYLYSAIDALIHAAESYVSPKANPYTRLFSKEAIQIILNIFSEIVEKGENYRFGCLEDMLIASNYAGIAFGNAGVGAVHALSYPLGSNYHVPHGEANYQFFTNVFRLYNKKQPARLIHELNTLLFQNLKISKNVLYKDEFIVYELLDTLLEKLIPKNSLHAYGMKEEDIDGFTTNVIETQQRLLANNYVPFTREEIRDIYTSLY